MGLGQLILFALNIDFAQNWELLLIKFEWLFITLILFFPINNLLLHHIFISFFPLLIVLSQFFLIIFLVNYFSLFDPYFFLLLVKLFKVIVIFCISNLVEVSFLLIFLVLTHCFLVKYQIFTAFNLLQNESWNLVLSYQSAIDLNLIVGFV